MDEYELLLNQIAGLHLGDGDVYDETYIATKIGEALKMHGDVIKDRDRIKENYINDFSKGMNTPPSSTADAPPASAPKIELSEYLNI